MSTDINSVISIADAFTHVRIINSMGISLCLSRLLVFASKFIQNPNKNKISLLHIAWVLQIFLWIILFWWEYLIDNHEKSYDTVSYALDLIYVFCLFFICVLMTPDDIKEYGSYEAYFFSRKRWLFALFIFLICIHYFSDIKSSLYINEPDDFRLETILTAIAVPALYFVGKINNKKFHYGLIIFLLLLSLLDFVIT